MIFYFTKHALIEMSDEQILMEDVKHAALHGETIRLYPDDPKGHSQLMLSYTSTGPIHVVCSQRAEEIHIITAYRPGNTIWETDLKTKKRNHDL